jgi:hypothetical protein
VIDGVEWAGAVLKPEAIKLKNVSTEDWQYFGYNQADIGRVVISQHELPTEAEVITRMQANGLTPKDASWELILKRLAQRKAEFTEPLGSGNVQDMIAAAKKGEMTMDFNLAGNSVDPTALSSTPSTYNFRLVNEKGIEIPKGQLDSYTGTMIPEFEVNGAWRSVTGDVDFLQITNGNGSPLDPIKRANVYRAMSQSVVGLLHGESATWTLKGTFDFAKKIGEFERAGTALMFQPDGDAIAAKFLAAEFKDPTQYTIKWDTGSKVSPTGVVAP